MFVSKINSTVFGGYRHSIGSAGEHLYRFSYPHDEYSQNVRIEFYKKDTPDNQPLKTIELKDTDTVNFDEIPELNDREPVLYRVFVNNALVQDTGLVVNGYNVINRNGTYPFVQGQGILTMPDIHRPGAYYNDFKSSKTGNVEYSIDKQKASENVIRTFSNQGGGTLAGIEYDIDELKKMGVKKVFMTPLWGGDNVSSHHYWNKNDMWISESVGNIDNYETMLRKMFKNGMQYVDDIAITSEGLEGVHVQYALRWANQNPQTYYWFRMNGLGNGPLIFGIVPKNMKNLRYRVVNPNVILNNQTGKVELNPDYNSNKETYFQVYDLSQVTKEQLANKDELIRNYKNTTSDNKLLINNSNDTIVNYALEIKPEEYRNRLEEFVKMNAGRQIPISLDSPEAALFIGQFTNFKIGNDAEGAVFWDANKDILKRNYYISSYDEKLIDAKPNQAERDNLRTLIKRANCEVQDMAIQAGLYRTQFVKDIQTLYTAQVLQKASTKEEIDNLIGNLLPKEAELDSETIVNVLDGWYNLSPKGVDSKDDITIRALMKLPLDSLEVSENTVGVLSTSFFTNRASSEENIGLSRFDFYKKGAGVYAPYHKTYHSADTLFETELKNFANDVIKAVNKSSVEKLINDKGDYTEYGEYVINLTGRDIAKYALLKALAGDKLQTKIMPDEVLKGKITYNYPELKDATTLKALGINASGPVEEAKALYKVLSDGLRKLNNDDVDYVAQSVLKQIEGTTLQGFRLAEAIVDKAGLGLDFRLDASKDIADMDAIRNGDMTFDEAWDQVIDFWKKYVSEIKKVNPNAYIVAEITDVEQLLKAIYGQDANVWCIDLSQIGGKYKSAQDAVKVFFEETGITSEASYSYTFTDLLRVFSADGEYGIRHDNGMYGLKNRVKSLLESNSLDYIRNLWTFADNHDKPSVLHVMALDMELFHTNNFDADYKDSGNIFAEDYYEQKKRNARISILQELTNSDRFEDIPLEAVMNLDNKDYFSTANSRAVAMSKLIREAVNDTIPDSFDKKALLKQAVTDLANGNYLLNDSNVNLETINIPALKTLESALDDILSQAGLVLNDQEKREIIEKSKQRGRIEKYAVRGDFDWQAWDGSVHWAGKEIQDRAKMVLANEEWDFMQYSPYVVSVAALITDSFREVMQNRDTDKFVIGTRAFVNKYNRSFVNNASEKLPVAGDSSKISRQKAYAARDIETVIEMVIQQAEFKTGVKFSQAEKDYVMKNLFVAATKPAVEKALMYSSYLSALPGIPSVFYRDILGGLGYDEKAKNIFLQNRNTVKYSELEAEGPLKEYRTEIFNSFREVMRIRSTEGLEAINSGTPYMLETNNPNSLAMLYQAENGEDVITILNNCGIDTRNKAQDFSGWLELNDIILPSALALTAGTVFVNILDKDKSEYLINRLENGLYRLIRKDGGKIVLNKDTAKHGAMFLRKQSKVVFRGKNMNQKYNIVTSPYKKSENKKLGENLSILAK